MNYRLEYYQKHRARIMAHNTKYRIENRDEINQRRRERYAKNPQKFLDRNNRRRKLKKTCSNLELTGYPISSLLKKGKFLLINLVEGSLETGRQVELDFRVHFERVLSAHDKLHLSRRYFIESTGNSVHVYIDSALQDYSKDELIDFLGVYKKVLEREVIA